MQGSDWLRLASEPSDWLSSVLEAGAARALAAEESPLPLSELHWACVCSFIINRHGVTNITQCHQAHITWREKT